MAGAHAVLGIIVTALAIINPIMATFRPEPAAPKRPLFNWFHSFVGNLARITSVAAMFFGKRTFEPELIVFSVVMSGRLVVVQTKGHEIQGKREKHDLRKTPTHLFSKVLGR